MSVLDLNEIQTTLLEACINNDLSDFVSIKSEQETLGQIELVFHKPYKTEKELTTANICLELACHYGYYEMIEFIIESFRPDLEAIHGSSKYIDYVDQKLNKNLKAAYLWYACQSYSLRIVKYFVALGANVNQNNESLTGSTPLM